MLVKIILDMLNNEKLNKAKKNHKFIWSRKGFKQYPKAAVVF